MEEAIFWPILKYNRNSETKKKVFGESVSVTPTLKEVHGHFHRKTKKKGRLTLQVPCYGALDITNDPVPNLSSVVPECRPITRLNEQNTCACAQLCSIIYFAYLDGENFNFLYRLLLLV